MASIIAPGSIDHVTGLFLRFAFLYTEPAAPDWWQFYNQGSCRMNNITSSLAATGLAGCVDYWSGNGAGGFGQYFSSGSPSNLWFLRSTLGMPSAYVGPWTEGTEYFVCRIVIDHQLTVGSGACSGCEIGVDIAFENCDIYQDGFGQTVRVDYPAARNSVKWNGGYTPTLNKTWGQIKAMYRQ